MGGDDELEALRAEVTALREEVRVLRASWQPQGGGTVVYPGTWPGNAWISPLNMCAGAAPVPQTVLYNTACAGTAIPADSVNWYPTAGAAGCGAPQLLTFTGTFG